MNKNTNDKDVQVKTAGSLKPRKALMVAVASATLLSGVPTAGLVANASPASNITQSGTIDADYGFMMHYTGKTVAKPASEKDLAKGTVFKNEDNTQMFRIDPYNKDNKGVKVKYTNIGTWKGKSVDMTVTLNDWKVYADNNAHMAFYLQDVPTAPGGFGFGFRGVESIDQTRTFTYSDTGKKIDDLKGVVSFGDIDASQYVTMPVTNYDEFFLAKNTTVKGKIENGEGVFRAPDNINVVPNDDKRTIVTATFTGSTIKNTYGMDYEMRAKAEPDSALGKLGKAYLDDMKPEVLDKFTTFELLYSFGKKPLPTETQIPFKTVTDTDEDAVTNNQLINKTEVYEYNVSHNFPDETVDFLHDYYEINDTVDPILDVVDGLAGIKVLDEDGRDVTHKFDMRYDEKRNYIQAIAKGKELGDNVTGKDSMYGHTYNLVFKAKIKEGADLTPYYDETTGKIQIPNKAGAKVDNDSQTSNTTKTDVPVVKMKAVKKIVDKNGKLLDEMKQKIGEDYKYRTDYFVPNEKLVKELVLYDDLEDVLDYKSIKVYDGDTDKEITKEGEISANDTTEKVSWKAKEPQKWAGRNIYTVITTKIKDDADLIPYTDADDNILIPNIANMIVNGKDEPTNEVTVTPSITSKATKYNLDEKGNRTTDDVAVEDGAKHKYELDFRVSNEKEITKLVLEDDLEDVLNLDDAKVFHGKTDITKQGELVLDAKTQKVTWTAKDPNAWAGKTVTLKIDATLIHGADLTPYIKNGKIVIPNTGLMTVNESELPTPPVDITTDGIKNDIEKFNVAKQGSLVSERKSADSLAAKDVMKKVAEGGSTEQVKDEASENNDGNDMEGVKKEVGTVVNSSDGETTQNIVQVGTKKSHQYKLDFNVTNTEKIDSLVIKDDLQNVIDLEKVRVFDGSKDVTAEGRTSIDDDKESFVWTANEPQKWQGKTLSVVIDAKLKEGSNLTPYIKDGHIDLVNVAFLEVNGKSEHSNPVVVTPDVEAWDNTETPKVEKFNVDGGKDTKETVIVPKGYEHKYNVVYDIANKRGMSTFTLRDDLEDVLDLKNVKIIQLNESATKPAEKEVDVTSKGKLTIDKEREIVEWVPNDASEFRSKKLKMEITSTVKPNADFDAYKERKVPNKATITIDEDKPVESNVVEIVTPQAEKYNVVDVSKNKTTKEEMQVRKGTDHMYEMVFDISNKDSLKTFTISDNLEDVMDIKDVQVFLDNKEVTADGTLVKDDTEESFKWTPKDASKYKGKTLKVRVSSTFKEGADLSAYTDGRVPNIANIQFDDEPTVPTNEVNITPPDDKVEKAQKFNIDMDNDDKRTKDEIEVKKGEDHSYELDFKLADKDLSTFKIEDDLEDVLDLKGVKIVVDSKDVTAQGDLVKDDEAESFTWTPKNAKDFRGKNIKVIVDAQLKEKADLSLYEDGKIPNIGSITVDKDPKVPTNEVNITPPTIESAEKFHSLGEGQKSKEDLSVQKGQNHEYELDFKIAKTSSMKTFTVSDDLEDVLDLKAVKIFLNGKDVTKDGTLVRDEKNEKFEWTPKDASIFKGQTLKVVVGSQLKPDADVSRYDNNLVPNVGHIKVDDKDPVPTDKVNITPSNAITAEKFNVDADGKPTKKQMVVAKGEDHTYQLNFALSDKNMSKFVITDDLEDVLDLKSVKVLADNKDVTADGTLDINDDEELFTWTPNDASAYDGKELKVLVNAQVKQDADIARYDDNLIPNIAKIKVDEDEPVETNKVEITPPKDPETPVDPNNPTDDMLVVAEKFNLNANGQPTKETQTIKVGDNHAYELRFNIPKKDKKGEAIKTFTIKDDLEDVLDYRNIKVTVDGKDVTGEGKTIVDNDKELFTWTPKDATKFAGKTVVVKVDTQLKEGQDLSVYGLKDVNTTKSSVEKEAIDEKVDVKEDVKDEAKADSKAIDKSETDEAQEEAKKGETDDNDKDVKGDAEQEKVDEKPTVTANGDIGVPNIGSIKVNGDDEVDTNKVLVVTPGNEPNPPVDPSNPNEPQNPNPQDPAQPNEPTDNTTTPPATSTNGNNNGGGGTTTTPQNTVQKPTGMFPQTGAESNVPLYASLAGILAVATGGLLWKRRRNKLEDEAMMDESSNKNEQ